MGSSILIFSVKKWRYNCIVLFTLFLVTKQVFAEGSKELASNGGNRAYLLSTAIVNASFPFPTMGTMKVYVKPGETICVGSSAQGRVNGTINLRAPDGTNYTSGGSLTVGLIANRDEEVAGPLPNTGGYQPYTVTAGAGQQGIWEVDFVSPNNGAEAGANPPAVPVASAWVQPSTRYIAAFDVSVRNAGNTAFLTGRVFTNVLSGILGTFNVGFNSVLNILTKDGYRYTLDNNGQAGNGFTFFVNNKGFRNDNAGPAYKSLDDTNEPNVYDPRIADSPSDITYKIFFNPPAADLPNAAAVRGGGTTWLVNTPVLPSLDNVGFTGADGKAGSADITQPGGSVNFTTTANGSYTVGIDINQNGVFTDAMDRRLTGVVKAGLNQVTWDGFDGLGNLVPISPKNYAVTVDATLFAAEVHFPFFDVERNVNGIKLTRINGANSPDNTIYWDDSAITAVGTPSNPLQNITGLSSLLNGHKWGSPSTAGDDNDFGNNKSIDTWAYVVGSALAAKTEFKMLNAGGDGTITTPNIFTPNGDGKNDFFEVKGINGYPGSRLLIFNRWGNEVYRSENYTNNWDGSGLADGTYFYLLEIKTTTGRTAQKGWIYLNRK